MSANETGEVLGSAVFTGSVFPLTSMEPRRRLGVAHVAEKQRPIFECEHFLHSGDFWGRDGGFILAVQIEAPDLRWAAEQIADIERICGRHDLLDDRFPGRNNFRGFFNSGVSSGRRRIFPRGASARESR